MSSEEVFDEDVLVAQLADHLDDVDAMAAILAPTVVRFVPLARKGAWAAEQVAGNGVIAPPAASFRAAWLGSWARFYVNAARAARGDGVQLPTDVTERTLILTWHDPGYPLLLRDCGCTGALALLAQECSWMARALGPANLYVFREGGPPRELVRAMVSGRAVVAMFDYCYDETASVVAPFLGRPCRTPIGLMRLASRFGYSIQVVSWNKHRPEVALSLPVADIAPADLAAAINACLTQAIAANPEAWLLWPSLDRRWVADALTVS